MDVSQLLKLALGPSGTTPVAPPGGVGGGSGIIRPPGAAPGAGIRITTPQRSMRTMTVGAQTKVGFALPGALIGTATAPQGHRMEGLGRGAVAGFGTGVGSSLGAGMGGLAGMGTGAAAAALAKLLGHDMDTGSAMQIGGVGGAGLGALAGGYAGFKGTQHMMGAPNWEDKAEKQKPQPKTAAAFGAAVAKPTDDMERRVQVMHAIRTKAHLPKAVTAPVPQTKMSHAQRFANGLAKRAFDMNQLGDMARGAWDGMGPTGKGAVIGTGLGLGSSLLAGEDEDGQTHHLRNMALGGVGGAGAGYLAQHYLGDRPVDAIENKVKSVLPGTPATGQMTSTPGGAPGAASPGPPMAAPGPAASPAMSALGLPTEGPQPLGVPGERPQDAAKFMGVA